MSVIMCFESRARGLSDDADGVREKGQSRMAPKFGA